ncbi:MAG TPA: cytochrome b/b6 domain-containing protein, partial [Bacteroidia bacterium]|nr:cytochrome b/b6 domain-containing protein [Bacteroidia bacterium]
NITVTAAQARSVAHEFNDMAWEWHTWLGYFLAGLFLFRIIFEFFQPQEQKLIPAIKKAMKYLKQPGIDKKYGRHFLFVKYLYVLFYFALFVQTCTGLFMAYSDDIEKLQDIRHTVSDIHSVFMWVIIGYVLLHVGGVIVTELGKKDKGIVSDMINGGE